MFDERRQTRGIFTRIRNLEPQERRATAASPDLRGQTELSVEAGIKSAPISQRKAAFGLHALDEQHRTVAFATKSFRQNLGDEFIWNPTGEAYQGNDSLWLRSDDGAAVRINGRQSPAIPLRGRYVSQSIHFIAWLPTDSFPILCPEYQSLYGADYLS